MRFRVVLSVLATALGPAAFGVAPAFAAAPEVPVAIGPPAITATTATLKGELGALNPGTPGEAGTYEFLYRPSETTCEGSEEEGGRTAPVPAGVALGLTPPEVELQPVTGLLPSTSYSFCLLARNMAEETAISVPVTFTTPAAAPAVVESVSSVEATAATLDAEVTPNGSETTAHFEYLTQAQYEADGNTFGEHTISTPESASVGSDDSVHPATPARIAERGQPLLTPSTTYRYRVVATNTCEGGKHCVTDGPGKSFNTYPTPGSEPAQNCPNEARRVEQAST